MAPISPGRPTGPPRKAPKQTATTKQHRFETFTKRISKLKIDPVHRVESTQSLEDDAGLTRSHFREALDYWTDLNLSQNYTDFARKTSPLSESLPQLLHHADTIFDLLLEHIEKKDSLALESLLNLVAQFAQDLRHKFEKYFSRTVSLVAQVAASHDAPDVIEWCFTCLAWIFKFLQRLLVPNLEPLLTIMVPYLAARKAYVVRFTAESLAFLLRKAAVLYPKNDAPLTITVTYLLETLQGLTSDSMVKTYQLGLMTLFSEAAVGSEVALHSCAPYLVSCISKTIVEKSLVEESQMQVLEGFVVSMIHQTDSEGFLPFMRLLHDFTSSLNSDHSDLEVQLAQRMLFLAIGTRKGSRIQNWSDCIQDILHVKDLTGKCQEQGSFHVHNTQQCFSMIAMAMQYAPIDELLPMMTELLEAVTKATQPIQFYQFSEFFESLGHDRFRSLLLPTFQQYILSCWKENEEALCLCLRALTQRRAIGIRSGSKVSTLISMDWEHHIVRESLQLSKLGEESLFVLQDAYLQLLDDFKLPQDSSNKESLGNTLHQFLVRKLQSTIKPSSSATRRFALGRVFSRYLDMATEDGLDRSMWESTKLLSPDHFRLPAFLESLNNYAARCPLPLMSTHETLALQERLLENLLSESKELKSVSLQLFRPFCQTTSESLIEAIELALEILKTPYTPQNVRQITMLLRRFPRHHKNIPRIFRKFIPQFCMGLLPTYYEKTRECLCTVLGELAVEPEDEAQILEIAMKWLQVPGPSSLKSEDRSVQETMPNLTPFQCSNVISVIRMISEITAEYIDVEQTLLRFFEHDHRFYLIDAPAESRNIVLQLFRSIPDIAERRSRLLVPIFLAAESHHKTDAVIPDSNDSTSSRTLSPGVSDADWTFRDRKAFVELLGKFKNPRVLYRSDEVHSALLDLLKIGNVEMQRLALKAISMWKDPTIQAHYDGLLRLLDDKTFSTEVALFLTSDIDESPIQLPQRPVMIDIILRLLYGQMIGRSGSHGSQEGKRRTILRMILRLPQTEISHFLKLSFRELADVEIIQSDILQRHLLETDIVPLDQQYGLLRMAHSVMDILQSQLAPLGEALLNPVLYCTARACHQLKSPTGGDEFGEKTNIPVMVRNIRKIGLQCLDMLFKHCDGISWSQYMDLIFLEMVRPRLFAFAIETAQSVSWLLRIFSTWSQSGKLVHFLNSYEEGLFGKVIDCLTTPTVKDEVKVFVLDQIVLPIGSLAVDNENPSAAAAEILQSHVQMLIGSLARVLDQHPSKPVLQSALLLLPELIVFTRSAAESKILLESLMNVLNDNTLHVSPKIKGDILKAVESLIQKHGGDFDEESKSQVWTSTSFLFNYFKDTSSRTILCSLLVFLAQDRQYLANISNICKKLNTTSSGKSIDFDIDIQISAFEDIKAVGMVNSTQMHWLPILSNLLYFSRTSEDFSVRSNAVSCLRYFILESCGKNNSDLEVLTKDMLLTAFKKGISEDSEAIRADYVALFGLVVRSLPEHSDLDDLRPLVVFDDDEASFFTNILHIQHHRRLRALRRLTIEVQSGFVKASHIATFFIPLLEKFVSNVEDDSNAQGLKGQSISTIGDLLLWVEWKQFKATFRRYKRDMDSKSRSEKDVIKLLGVCADALLRARNQLNENNTSESRHMTHLASSLPASVIITNELRTHFIPQLTAFVHLKDETQISVRLPAAVVVVKLIKMLPEESLAQLIPPLLLDTTQILRSRAQESRDAARNVLAEIVLLLGPSSFHFVLKELRTTLNRGYQLHVVSYTVHSILLSSVPTMRTGALDYCLSELVAVVMDDIFGVVGQEKESQDYISSMREVKSSKSFDSIELLATCTGVSALSKLLRPLQSLLEGNLNPKQARQVDELLRRIGMGLSRNEAASSRDLLTFSYELIQDFYRQKKSLPDRTTTTDEKNRKRYLIQPTYAIKSAGGISSPLFYKVAQFALDMVRSTLLKHSILLTAQNMHGFLPIIGDALIEAQEEVKTSALRLLSAVIKLPMPELDTNAELYISEAVKIVRDSTSTNSESSQAALKLIAAIIRERKNMAVRNTDLAYLLHRVLPDLEEPDRQGVTFNFVKAVMARKIAVPEVYEIADKLGIMMVTNHTRDARDVARGVYVHFLLDYPQTKSRWTKQVKFLLKNLDYKHPEGRQSVMEALNILLAKIGDEMVEEIVSTFVIPILLRMANDENKDCRDMAEVLLGQLFQKAAQAQTETLLEPLRAWVDQSENPALTKLGMQAFGIFLDYSKDNFTTEIVPLRSSIEKSLALYSRGTGEDWETAYHSTQLLLKMVAADPASVMSRRQATLWDTICSLLSSPHHLLQHSVAGLLGAWFRDLSKTNIETGLSKVPLPNQYGLVLRGDVILDLLRSSLRIIKYGESSDAGNAQITRNLIFIGRCISVNELMVEIRDRSMTEEIQSSKDEEEINGLSDDEDEEQHTPERMKEIPAIHYVFHQCASILRHETPRATTISLKPKKTILQLLASLLPHTPAEKLLQPILHNLLLPLTHLADPHVTAPRSADPAFGPAYIELTEAAHVVIEAMQKKVGDGAYVKAVTAVAKSVRERRQERRKKRVIERVAEPEKAAMKKKKLGERKSERKKELTTAFRTGRRGA